MNRKDLELPPELAEMVARRRRLSRAPEEAKARLHRRLAWAFTSPSPKDQPASSHGLFQRLLGFRLAAFPAALLAYLPLAAAGIGFGALSLSVVHVMSRRVDPPGPHPSSTHRAVRSQPGEPSALPPMPQLDPLPETLPTPEAVPEKSAPALPQTPSPMLEMSAPPPARAPGVGAAPLGSTVPPAPAVSPPSEPHPEMVPPGPVAHGGTVEAGSGASPPALAPSLERQLLEQARLQLRSGAVSGALATLDQHRRLYPQGQLSEEREVLIIEATVRFRGSDAARPMVESFRQRFPRSPLLPALESFLKSNQPQPPSMGVP